METSATESEMPLLQEGDHRPGERTGGATSLHQPLISSKEKAQGGVGSSSYWGEGRWPCGHKLVGAELQFQLSPVTFVSSPGQRPGDQGPVVIRSLGRRWLSHEGSGTQAPWACDATFRAASPTVQMQDICLFSLSKVILISIFSLTAVIWLMLHSYWSWTKLYLLR